MSIVAGTRDELTKLARRTKARITISTPLRPTHWRPGSGHNPNGILDTHFTEAGARELITTQLKAGCKVETVQLQKPPCTTGYVMKIELSANEPMLYIKLELGSGKIFGRSFHYSTHPNKTGDNHGNK